MYGITETTVHVTYHPLRSTDAAQRVGSPIGVRIPDLRVYVLDGRRGAVAGRGGGRDFKRWWRGRSRGYLGRAELTSERFVPDRSAQSRVADVPDGRPWSLACGGLWSTWAATIIR